jgi:uncharacterized protein
MLDLGFDKLSMEPVVCSPDDPYAVTEADIDTLYEQYELLAEDMRKDSPRAGAIPLSLHA